MDSKPKSKVSKTKKPLNEMAPHYQNTILPNNIECIDVAQHFNFNKGNAIKYIWLAGSKGDPVKDLKKAIEYLQFEINLIENPNSLRNFLKK